MVANMVYIRIEAEIRATEDENKVIQALKNLVYPIKIRIERVSPIVKIAIGESNDVASLQPLHDKLRKQRILDTARNIMLRGLRRENTIVLRLNKQAAYQGIVSFIDSDLESPLGGITLTIVGDNLEDVVDWLAPRTARGRPLWERPPPRT